MYGAYNGYLGSSPFGTNSGYYSQQGNYSNTPMRPQSQPTTGSLDTGNPTSTIIGLGVPRSQPPLQPRSQPPTATLAATQDMEMEAGYEARWDDEEEEGELQQQHDRPHRKARGHQHLYRLLEASNTQVPYGGSWRGWTGRVPQISGLMLRRCTWTLSTMSKVSLRRLKY